MADTEAQLEKFMDGELQTLSPLMKQSLALKAKADAVAITDKDSYVDAKKLKRELVSHRTSVKDMRLTFTRKLDNMKDQFIKKQDEVLEPSIAGEAFVKEQIGAWEDEQKRLKEAEETRIKGIITKLSLPTPPADATLEDIKRARAALKMEIGLLDVKDRNKVVIKNQIAETRARFDEREEFIVERNRQAEEAEAQRIEREKIDADRKALEAEKAQSVTESPKTSPTEPFKSGAASPTHTVIAGELEVDDDELVESVGSATKQLARKAAEDMDLRLKHFLEKHGIEVNLRDIEGLKQQLFDKGYRLDREEQVIEPEEGEYSRRKHTWTLVKIVDIYTYDTVMTINPLNKEKSDVRKV